MRNRLIAHIILATVMLLGLFGCRPIDLTETFDIQTQSPLTTEVEPNLTKTPTDDDLEAKTRAEIYVGEKLTELSLLEVSNMGNEHRVRFQQVYQGIPVFSAILSVYVPKNGQLSSNGTFYPKVKIESLFPNVSAGGAVKTIVDLLGTPEKYEETQKPILMIYPAERAGQVAGEFSLIWQFRITTNCPLGEWFAVVDANTGQPLELANVMRIDGEIGKKCATPEPLPTITLAPPVPKYTPVNTPEPSISPFPVTPTSDGYPAPNDTPEPVVTEQVTETAKP